MIELGEYMLHVKNKRMLQLTDEIENSKKHLLYIIDVHIFSQEDIILNTKTLGWPVKIRPVFEQNTEIVEDCKARFEDNLQKKSEWTSRELEKLAVRVQELEELGEIANVQQYTYVKTSIYEYLSVSSCIWLHWLLGSAYGTKQIEVHRGHHLLDQPRRGALQIPSILLSRCGRCEHNTKWRRQDEGRIRCLLLKLMITN